MERLAVCLLNCSLRILESFELDKSVSAFHNYVLDGPEWTEQVLQIATVNISG
jgi:hypothetical protein